MDKFKADFIVVFITSPKFEEAKIIAKTLVEKKLSACVNIIPEITSIYHWEGKICEDNEILLIVKTTKEKYPLLEEEVKRLHSYSVPEIISLPIIEGSKSYLEWVKKETIQNPPPKL